VSTPSIRRGSTRSEAPLLHRIKVVGEIDNTYRYQFESWLGAAVELAGLPENAGLVAVDLLGVSFLGSAGLSALVRATGLAQASGKSLRIVVNDHRPVLRPIQLMGLDQMLPLCCSLADALRLEL
jgi:anti-sigma B factor antagonist